MIKNAGLVIISLMLGLILIEIAIRIFVPISIIGPAFSVYDETYGKKLKPSFSTVRLAPEYTMKFRTNSFGFRGSEPAQLPRRPILFLGDSFTLGHGVNDGQEFPALVGETLKNHFEDVELPIVNAGLGSNGNGRSLKFLRSEGRDYDPRLIVWELMSNDFGDNPDESLFDLASENTLVELPVPSKSLLNRLQDVIDTVPGLANTYSIGFARQYLVPFLRRKLNNNIAPNSIDNTRDELTYAIIWETLKIIQNNNWPVFALTVEIEGNRLAKIKKYLSSMDILWCQSQSSECGQISTIYKITTGMLLDMSMWQVSYPIGLFQTNKSCFLSNCLRR